MKHLRTLALALCLFALPAALVAQVGDKITVGGPVAPDGKTEVQVDLPSDLLKRNIAARGLGCCVFRSFNYAGIWQNIPQVIDMPEWMVSKGIAGGGYPEKADQLIPRISKDRGMETPAYLQYEGKDPSILELALRTGRLPCITYNGYDPHYGNHGISHMVCLVHLDPNYAAIRDNNFTGPDDLVWMSRADFLRRWTGGRSGWAVIFLAPPPPPVPRN